MLKIWLDDTRDAPEGWLHFKTAESLIEHIEMIGWHRIEVISLDHDLGENVQTGYDFIKWAENWFNTFDEKHMPRFDVHSANPVGAKNIRIAIQTMEKYFR